MGTKRPYIARYFEVVIDDEQDDSAIVASVDLGPEKGELISQSVGGHLEQVKSIARAVPSEITIKIGMVAGNAFFKWLEKSWSGEVERRSGSIITYDVNFNIVHEFEFKEALITEVTLPALDATSKEAFYLTVKIQPEEVFSKPGSGRRAADRVSVKQKKILVSNFRVDIDGLDCKRINKVESITVKQKVVPFNAGTHRHTHFEPHSFTIPNLTMSVPQVDSDKWLDWGKVFFQEAEKAFDMEKTATITLLDQELKTPYFEIDFYDLGPVSMAMDKADNTAGQDAVKRLKAELYCQRMKFTFL